MTATISRRLLASAVATRLVGVTNATGYFGQIGRPLPGVTGTPANPPPKSATDLRVQPYFILFPGVGNPTDEKDLGDTLVDLDWPIQITAAGGDIDDVLALVDRIDARLFRWAPALDGVVCGPLRPPPGYRPPVLVDNTHTPDRLYTPLQYQSTATT